MTWTRGGLVGDQAQRLREEAVAQAEAQAKTYDHEDLLSSTPLTADLGKLYLLLSKAVGRLD